MNDGNSSSDPLATVLFYYILYSEIGVATEGIAANEAFPHRASTGATRQNQHPLLVDVHTLRDIDCNEDREEPRDGSSEPPWVEDHWTEREEAHAAALLETNRSRCRVQSLPRRSNANVNATAWNRFYANHTTNFFKDRHYLSIAFPHEFGDTDPSSNNVINVKPRPHRCLVEIGCGVGNTMLPLLECTPGDNDETAMGTTIWTVHGLDVSSVAIALIHEDERFQHAQTRGRATAHVFDITNGTDRIPAQIQNVAHVTSLLFCLSAIDPTRFDVAVHNAVSTLSRHGVLIFRDYGRYDAAQLKLGSQRGKLLSDDTNRHAAWYRKHDGTQCYYFTVPEVMALMATAGLETIECDYIKRVYRNRSTDTPRRRVWVQGRFRRQESRLQQN